MRWLERDPARRADPRRVVASAKTVLVVSRSYFTDLPVAESPRDGRISRYAWGAEYHDVMGAAIKRLYARIEELMPGASGRYYVDTGPVMEKAWAEVSGLGWIGKHTNVIQVGTGSWFFLGAIVLDCELPVPKPAPDHCGSCVACIDACPTGAIVAPYVLDARRCISYLTIEHRGAIDREFRADIGNRVFGCDDCQEVCPWNRFAQLGDSARPFMPAPGRQAAPLLELFALSVDEFRERFRRSPVKRAKYEGFRRNVAIALGNSADPSAVGALARALDDVSAIVRGHSAWALGRLGGSNARTALREALVTESDPWVRDEIAYAETMIDGSSEPVVAS